MIKNCLTCNKEFITYLNQIKKGYGKYCSRRCQPPTFGNQGKKASLETRQKMSKSRMGHPPPKTSFKKGMIPWNKNKKFPQISGENNINWKDGIIKHSFGYIKILSKNHPLCDKAGYVFEHRLIAERQLNRFLRSEEQVHHINKIKNDNRIENLMCFSSNSAHGRFHVNPKNVKPSEIIFDGRSLTKSHNLTKGTTS